ncbi:hypothetical protein S101446_02187 [Komagataeibacter europaeus]|nr:hypothetical protein S101446_02187 [Komagataeibacter europaeus]
MLLFLKLFMICRRDVAGVSRCGTIYCPGLQSGSDGVSGQKAG